MRASLSVHRHHSQISAKSEHALRFRELASSCGLKASCGPPTLRYLKFFCLNVRTSCVCRSTSRVCRSTARGKGRPVSKTENTAGEELADERPKPRAICRNPHAHQSSAPWGDKQTVRRQRIDPTLARPYTLYLIGRTDTGFPLHLPLTLWAP
jgi:hypothetical protein